MAESMAAIDVGGAQIEWGEVDSYEDAARLESHGAMSSDSRDVLLLTFDSQLLDAGTVLMHAHNAGDLR
ncbi:hypothetical protein [Nocardia gipuzkoensis]